MAIQMAGPLVELFWGRCWTGTVMGCTEEVYGTKICISRGTAELLLCLGDLGSCVSCDLSASFSHTIPNGLDWLGQSFISMEEELLPPIHIHVLRP